MVCFFLQLIKTIKIFDLIFDKDLILTLNKKKYNLFAPEGHEYWSWLQIPLHNGGEGEQEERGGSNLYLDVSVYKRHLCL